jgi:hypothetical protein
MKVVSPSSRRESGSVLIGAMIIALVLGVTLISYLSLTSNQYRSIFRSQTWSTSLALTEAGIEEALAMVNKYVDTGTDITNWVNTAGVDGWTVSGNVFSVTRNLPAGSYTVFVTNVGLSPMIYAKGNAEWKMAQSPMTSFIATLGGGNYVTQTRAPETVNRQVEVRTRRSSVFTVAMVALGQIDLKGNNIRTDSFDSSTNSASTGGKYDPAKSRDNGSVITTSTLIDSLNAGNAKIKGLAKTGPNGTIKIGPNGSVGSSAWVDSGKTGIQPGYSANDVNLQFPDATLPSVTGGWVLGAPPGATIGGVTYDQVYLGGNYQVSTISGKKLYIATNANVKIYITGNVSMAGSDSITIAPQNASLAIYMAGNTFKAAGNAALNNLSEKAENFAYYGLPSNKTVQFNGNANFIGTIYAPQADFSLGGGGNDEYDFVGASVTKTVTMNGKFNFHYDENLAKTGPARGYVPTLWAER